MDDRMTPETVAASAEGSSRPDEAGPPPSSPATTGTGAVTRGSVPARRGAGLPRAATGGLPPDLRPALRSAVNAAHLEALVAAYGSDLTSLAAVTPEALLAGLDAAPLYSPGRDALLADLLRLYHRCHDGAPLALLYDALLPGLARVTRRVGRGPEGDEESRATVLYAAALAIDAFVPERRSAHVQAGLEMDIYHRVWQAWRDDARRRRAHTAGAQVWAQLRPEHSDAWSLDELLGVSEPAAPRAETFDTEERDAALRLLESAVARGVLCARDVSLLLGARVDGRRIASVAAELGMSAEAAKKAIQRASRALRAAWTAEFGERGGRDEEG